MNTYYKQRLMIVMLVALSVVSCKKFLDTKSDQRLSTPDTLEDLQAMMDHGYIYRYGNTMTQTMSDEYYFTYVNWQTRTEPHYSGYIWAANTDNIGDWDRQYSLVLIANTVLDRVDKIADPATNPVAAQLKGAALFLRAHCNYQVAELYAPQYDPATAANDLGIVLRLEPDFNIPSKRATVQQTYDQILGDLQQAIPLLPPAAAAKTRASRATAYALLARVQLQIGKFAEAGAAANQSLAIYDKLIDFNDPVQVNPASTTPILKRGIENGDVLYYHNDEGSATASPSALIDSNLYNSYSADDLRKTVYFRSNNNNTYRFKGSYSGNAGWFTGFCTPEMYLVRAECQARAGNIAPAIQDLQTLLAKRYKPNTAPVFNPATPNEALMLVLAERKKEMVYRGVRWSDLRRLNKNPATAITIKRELNGTIYTLPPNDLRYTMLIPTSVMNVIKLPQNPR